MRVALLFVGVGLFAGNSVALYKAHKVLLFGIKGTAVFVNADIEASGKYNRQSLPWFVIDLQTAKGVIRTKVSTPIFQSSGPRKGSLIKVVYLEHQPQFVVLDDRFDIAFKSYETLMLIVIGLSVIWAMGKSLRG